MSDNEMSDESAALALDLKQTLLDAGLRHDHADDIGNAVLALIDSRLADMANSLSYRIEDAIGVRP